MRSYAILALGSIVAMGGCYVLGDLGTDATVSEGSGGSAGGGVSASSSSGSGGNGGSIGQGGSASQCSLLPNTATENCNTVEKEGVGCDDIKAEWTLRLGGAGQDQLTGITWAPGNSIVFGGSTDGSITISNSTLTFTKQRGYLASLASSSDGKWIREAYAEDVQSLILDVQTDGTAVYAAGQYDNSSATNAHDGFLGKYDLIEGKPITGVDWPKLWGTKGEDLAIGLAQVNDSVMGSRVYVAAATAGGGKNPCTQAEPFGATKSSTIIMNLDANDASCSKDWWFTPAPLNSATNSPLAIAAFAQDGVVAVGHYTGESPPLPLKPSASATQTNGYITRLRNDQSVAWALSFMPDNGGMKFTDVVVSPSDGRIYATGVLDSATIEISDLNKVYITTSSSHGFVMALSPEGKVQWFSQFGGKNVRPDSITMVHKKLFVAGVTFGLMNPAESPDINDGPQLCAFGTACGFLLELEADCGTSVWGAHFGGLALFDGKQLYARVDGKDDLLVLGLTWEGGVDFAPLGGVNDNKPKGDSDILITKFSVTQ